MGVALLLAGLGFAVLTVRALAPAEARHGGNLGAAVHTA
jgi:hypothetical protein